MKSKQMMSCYKKICRMDDDKQTKPLRDFRKKHHIKMNSTNDTQREIIQRHIQTQAAADTVIIAKWSCFCAAVAAFCSLIIILTMKYEVVLNSIFALRHYILRLINSI